MKRKIIAFLLALCLIALAAGCDFSQPDGGNETGQPYPANSLPNDRDWFPIGVWLERVDSSADCTLFEGLGFTFFGGIQANSDLADADACDMKLLVQTNELGVDNLVEPGQPGDEAYDGYFIGDEADMTFGPGADDWNGTWAWNTCDPIQDLGGKCGYTVTQAQADLVPNGALKWANYGKGVLEWETFEEASGFVNGAWATDAVSADKYWFTDPNITDADRKGANYGEDLKRMRVIDGLDGFSPAERQPVWAVIEAGRPFGDGEFITPEQMYSAAFHALIGGARGIEWFVHNFEEPWGMVTRNCLGDGSSPDNACPDNRDQMQLINERILELAPVLNSTVVSGYSQGTQNIKVRTMWGGNDAPFGNGFYTIAGAGWSELTDPGSQEATITFDQPSGAACPSTATVLYESRNVAIDTNANGDCEIVDDFATGDTIHIYKQNLV